MKAMEEEEPERTDAAVEDKEEDKEDKGEKEGEEVREVVVVVESAHSFTDVSVCA